MVNGKKGRTDRTAKYGFTRLASFRIRTEQNRNGKPCDQKSCDFASCEEGDLGGSNGEGNDRQLPMRAVASRPYCAAASGCYSIHGVVRRRSRPETTSGIREWEGAPTWEAEGNPTECTSSRLLLREDDADLGGTEQAVLDHVCEWIEVSPRFPLPPQGSASGFGSTHSQSPGIREPSPAPCPVPAPDRGPRADSGRTGRRSGRRRRCRAVTGPFRFRASSA